MCIVVFSFLYGWVRLLLDLAARGAITFKTKNSKIAAATIIMRLKSCSQVTTIALEISSSILFGVGFV